MICRFLRCLRNIKSCKSLKWVTLQSGWSNKSKSDGRTELGTVSSKCFDNSCINVCLQVYWPGSFWETLACCSPWRRVETVLEQPYPPLNVPDLHKQSPTVKQLISTFLYSCIRLLCGFRFLHYFHSLSTFPY